MLQEMLNDEQKLGRFGMKKGTLQEGKKHEQIPETSKSIVGLGLQGARGSWDQASWAWTGGSCHFPGYLLPGGVLPKAEGRREN